MNPFNTHCIEYVWIDAVGNTRSKLRVLELRDATPKNILSKIPEWNFDGSSTGQAEGRDSDVILRPVSTYRNPFIDWCNAYLVLCECYNKDGSVHETNTRSRLLQTYEKCKDSEPWFGIEQEFVLHDRNGVLYKWLDDDMPGCGTQGPYYCSAGGQCNFGREVSMAHLKACLRAGLKICGTNAEVLPSQWEYQIGPLDPIAVSDQLWISRYILNRVCETFNCCVSFHPKPKSGDWNGSGGHTNFSTKQTRQNISHIYTACEKLALKHAEHMAVYGKDNHLRLTGKHETSSMLDFSWGVSDRGRSIRIPLNVYNDGKGYLEDRRPAANLDPYLVAEIMMRTVILE